MVKIENSPRTRCRPPPSLALSDVMLAPDCPLIITLAGLAEVMVLASDLRGSSVPVNAIGNWRLIRLIDHVEERHSFHLIGDGAAKTAPLISSRVLAFDPDFHIVRTQTGTDYWLPGRPADGDPPEAHLRALVTALNAWGIPASLPPSHG